MKIKINEGYLARDDWICEKHCPLFKLVSDDCKTGNIQCNRIIGLTIER